MDLLTPRDRARLAGVHPDLVRVVRRARLTARFFVIEGLRTPERQAQLVREGKSKTLNSRHLSGHAVDLGAVDAAGALTWQRKAYDDLWRAVQVAANVERVPIEWGGLFPGFFDGPHFQLPWKQYPANG